MGLSPDWEIFYGFEICASDYETAPWENDPDWYHHFDGYAFDQWIRLKYAKRFNLPVGKVVYRLSDGFDPNCYNRQHFLDWFDDPEVKKCCEEIKRLSYGCEIINSGVSDGWEGKFCVCLGGTVLRGEWGPVPLPQLKIPTDADPDSKIREFCEIMGIEFKEPCWMISANYI